MFERYCIFSCIWSFINEFFSFLWQPPIVPKVSHEGDTSNFDTYPEDEWKKDTPVAAKDLEIFKNFWKEILFNDTNDRTW